MFSHTLVKFVVSFLLFFFFPILYGSCFSSTLWFASVKIMIMTLWILNWMMDILVRWKILIGHGCYDTTQVCSQLLKVKLCYNYNNDRVVIALQIITNIFCCISVEIQSRSLAHNIQRFLHWSFIKHLLNAK